MDKKNIRSIIEETYYHDKDILFADGFDEAILGVAFDRWGEEPCHRVVYDQNKIIEIIEKEFELATSEAQEYYEFNIEGSYVGPNTPIFIDYLK
jgi:hypothetical protein